MKAKPIVAIATNNSFPIYKMGEEIKEESNMIPPKLRVKYGKRKRK